MNINDESERVIAVKLNNDVREVFVISIEPDLSDMTFHATYANCASKYTPELLKETLAYLEKHDKLGEGGKVYLIHPRVWMDDIKNAEVIIQK